MTDAPGSDRSLLDRLNALKLSTVSLDPPSKTIAASTIESAKPLSREDALSERLKSLRNQSSNNAQNTSGSGVNDGSGRVSTTPSSPQPQPQLNVKSPDVKISASEVPAKEEENDEEMDSLLEMDEDELEAFLSNPEAEAEWVNGVLAEDEHRKATKLLEELGKADGGPGAKTDHDGSGEGNSDDSDAEYMTREVEIILDQAADEVDLEKANKPLSQPDSTPTSPTKDINQAHDKKPGETIAPNDTSPFNFPTVPSSLQDQPTPPPLAPSQDDTSSDDDADFAASINSRMAALRLATPPRDLPSAPTTAVDAFGLPAAPTFAPADRPLPGLIKRHGFTDEDQKTWCTVCLEDGTVRCIGCDGDVYCARCWREMHVGPRAGYDERGHRWEKFDTKGRE
ncbi:hypothetical protein F4805DRAFT_420518 [Annulohypoxylon moriforme]|nr:hypothetical protein F4805DRAFT_420518 [Annulohypoxylon moriforme]